MMSDWYESMDDINISENNQVITTFDNITHEIDELLDKMMDDNFYYGYLGKYALSSSSSHSQ